jgi:lysophospholipase L1-like esterase
MPRPLVVRIRRGLAAPVLAALVVPLALFTAEPARAGTTAPSTLQASADPTVYVALGDSYSSGEANPPFSPVHPACHRSESAWPNLLADREGLLLAANLACSGAATEDLTKEQNGAPPQAQALAAVRPSPDLVTITIGGNDAGFAPTLAQCFLADCWELGGIAGSRLLIRYVLPDRLEAAYKQVRAAAPGAELVVVGYPRLFPSRQSAVVGCRWLSSKERVELNRTADLLNATIRTAAARAGATYVDVSRTLKRHELCTKDSWVYPVAEDFNLQYSAHPTLKGQQAVAARVARALR